MLITVSAMTPNREFFSLYSRISRKIKTLGAIKDKTKREQAQHALATAVAAMRTIDSLV